MTEELYMKRCLELAALGRGSVSPNPMVGCVIVHDGRIIGEGWHRQYGEAHAEVNAVTDAEKKQGTALFGQSTLYVNLEPCSHWGKTPPCADLIIGKGIPKVVIGCIDSNSKVSGQGIKRMREAGIEVTVGVLEKESLDLNRRFFTAQVKKRPYIILKWAQTADGYLDAVRPSADIPPAWMTGRTAKILVHKWRSEEDAILVGRRTMELDRPALTVREWIGRNPRKVILQGGQSIEDVLRQLQEEKVQSLFVEGGAQTLQGFIDKGLWDEARIFTARDKTLATLYDPALIPNPQGVPTPVLRGTPSVQECIEIGHAQLQVIRNAEKFQ